MNELEKKLDHLKWLKSAGIEYYCSKEKDSTKSLINKFSKTKDTSDTEKIGINKIGKKKFKPAHESSKISEIENITMARKLADETETLADLRAKVENFNGCDLKKFATHTVFSDGQASSRILLIGEAPGAQEDARGIPFCGESGKLLDNMLASIGLSRKINIYITNTIFWRPPANRRPTKEEIDICKPFVEKHIALINPLLIILVGSTAATTIMGKEESMGHLRKNYHFYTNKYLSSPIPTAAIFHPAYLLRQPNQKKETWFDLLKIQQFISELTR